LKKHTNLIGERQVMKLLVLKEYLMPLFINVLYICTQTVLCCIPEKCIFEDVS
jgi:hypothetical protein